MILKFRDEYVKGTGMSKEAECSAEIVHAHWALFLHQEPLVDAIYVEVVLAGQNFDHLLWQEGFLADDADLLSKSGAAGAA